MNSLMQNERLGCDAQIGYNLGGLVAEAMALGMPVAGAVEPDCGGTGFPMVCRHRRNTKALERLESVVRYGRGDEAAEAAESIARRHGQWNLLRSRRQATETQLLRQQVDEARAKAERAAGDEVREARRRLASLEDALLWRTNPAQAQRAADLRKREAEKARRAQELFLRKVRENLAAYERQQEADREQAEAVAAVVKRQAAENLMQKAQDQAQQAVAVCREREAEARSKAEALAARRACGLEWERAVAACRAARSATVKAEAALRERLAESCGCA